MNKLQLHLISHALCPYVQRAVIVLKEKDVEYTRTDINLSDKPAWFTRISPLGKVPVLVIEQYSYLFESAVICEYLDEVTKGAMHPASPLEKALHRSWIEFGSGILVLISKLYCARSLVEFEDAHAQLIAKFSHLEKVLNETGYFAGKQFHLIDAVYGPIFRYFDVFDTIVRLDTFQNLPKCQAWRHELSNRISVQNAVSQDYSARLKAFIAGRESYLSTIIKMGLA